MDDAKTQQKQQIYNEATLKSMGSKSFGGGMKIIFLAMDMWSEEELKVKNQELIDKQAEIDKLVASVVKITQKHAEEISALQVELRESKLNKARTHNSEILDEFFYESECKKLKANLEDLSAAVIEFVDADGSKTCEKMLNLVISNTPAHE